MWSKINKAVAAESFYYPKAILANSCHGILQGASVLGRDPQLEFSRRTPAAALNFIYLEKIQVALRQVQEWIGFSCTWHFICIYVNIKLNVKIKIMQFTTIRPKKLTMIIIEQKQPFCASNYVKYFSQPFKPISFYFLRSLWFIPPGDYHKLGWNLSLQGRQKRKTKAFRFYNCS